MKGTVLIMVLVLGLIISLLLIPSVSTVNKLIKAQEVTSIFVAQEEALNSGIDYARYLIANEKMQGVLSLPQGTVEVIMNIPDTVGDVYEYYDILIVYKPQLSAEIVWIADLVRDTVTLSSWVVSVEEGGGH